MSLFMKIFPLHLILVSTLLLSAAQSASAITREAAIEYALEHSEAVKMALESAHAIRGEADQATAFTLPQANMEAGYLEMGDNVPDSPFPIPGYPEREISAQIGLNQLLYAGGRIKKSWKLKDRLYEQADLTAESGARDVKGAVRSRFNGVLYQKASVAILFDRVEQRLTELEDARDLREVGMVTSLDVRQANLNLNLARDELSAAQAAHQDRLIAFNLSMGRSVQEELWAPDGSLQDIPDLSGLIERLQAAMGEADLLDIGLARKEAQTTGLQYEIAEGERFPSLMLVSSAKSSGEEVDGMDESWALGLQLQWNAFDGGLIRSRMATRRAQHRRAQANLTRAQKEIDGQIESIIVNIRSLENRVRLQQEAVALSKENYEDARGHYRAGTITLTRMGEFNLNYAEARFNLLRIYFLLWEKITDAAAILEPAA